VVILSQIRQIMFYSLFCLFSLIFRYINEKTQDIIYQKIILKRITNTQPVVLAGIHPIQQAKWDRKPTLTRTAEVNHAESGAVKIAGIANIIKTVSKEEYIGPGKSNKLLVPSAE